MEALKIIDEIIERFTDTMDIETSMYTYSAAIYDVWSTTGSELEKNLATRLVNNWVGRLDDEMRFRYRETRHDPARPEFDAYGKSWINGHKRKYEDHKGLLAALEILNADWEKKGWDLFA